MPPIPGYETPYSTGCERQFRMIMRSVAATRRCANVAIHMAALFEVWLIDCLNWHALYCAGESCLIRRGANPSKYNHHHPFVRLSTTSLRPDLPLAERRAQVLSRMPRSGTGALRAGAQRPGLHEHGAILQSRLERALAKVRAKAQLGAGQTIGSPKPPQLGLPAAGIEHRQRGIVGKYFGRGQHGT